MSTQDNPISAAFAPDSLSGASEQVLSHWTTSPAKRIFDVTSLLVFAPLWIPLLFVLAVIVRASSHGPVIFQQKRIGRSCRPFTIYKFRTMRHDPHGRRNAIAAVAANEITAAGHILRRFKLDELPQLINVLLGHMSLVGPRPKVPEQQLEPLACHPGITGSATLAFAREEILFSQIPEPELNAFYRDSVLPTKHRLDAEYMRCATFAGDLAILMDTVLGKWGSGESVNLHTRLDR
ncbi:sugar transferase [Terracidiphilus gabretensis]|jgi:lipopolysaccharide/colanic/teichoic acid biosynthesis glycosyltransferase|uniref:sugar transferase n=1 Tax=Terracidiphilus gabretensis TaxID=1577687 RepID=UPI00071BDA8A|nr:sugar transferase [Terracidiphilus gabretensis]